jgi:hypothetical protein
MATKDQQSFEDREQGSTYEARKLGCCRPQFGRLGRYVVIIGWSVVKEDLASPYCNSLRRQKVDDKLSGTVANDIGDKLPGSNAAVGFPACLGADQFQFAEWKEWSGFVPVRVTAWNGKRSP